MICILFLDLGHFTTGKVNVLFAGLGSFSIVKNCNLGLKNAARDRRPRVVVVAFLRPRSQSCKIQLYGTPTVRNSQPANNIYLCIRCDQSADCFV